MNAKYILPLALLAGLLLTASLHAQIFIVNQAGTIGEYNLDGTPINTSLITGLSDPQAISVSGSNLFVSETNGATGWIGKYNLDGTPVNTSLFTLGAGPHTIAVSGNNLLVASNDWTDGKVISEYTTSGVLLNASLVPTVGNGTGFVNGIAVSGGNMFITVEGNGNNQVAEYTISGLLVNNSLLAGVGTDAIAVSGTNLFVSDYSGGMVGEYTTTGGTVNANLNANDDNALALPGSLAVSGSNLFVATYNGAPAIAEYSLDTSTANSSLIVPASSSPISAIAVEPQAPGVPAAPAWALLATVAGLLVAAHSQVKA